MKLIETRYGSVFCVKNKDDMKHTNRYKDKILYRGSTLNVISRDVEIQNQIISYEVINRPNVAIVIPELNKKEIVFIHQYRSTINTEIIELPGGKISKNETGKEAARRELLEETGYYANLIEKIGEFYTAPHITNELIKVYVARNLEKRKKDLQPKELITNNILLINEVSNIFKKGPIDGKTITALSFYLNSKIGL